ncbi:MAG TPA: hypothetical protein VMW27_15030 [Thermoanaerobaculia bacterium]|nr:hypothetical protein [Thermoanaerobaculia bacterium]
MRKTEALRRLDEIPAGRDEALRPCALLARELEEAVQEAERRATWKLEPAELLAGSLENRLSAALDPGVSAATRERLAEALAGGPPALAQLHAELRERLREAQVPEERLRTLRLLRHCQELRLRCLEHLDTLFEARRSQP